jgi:3-hydroxyisobutyrate dehydrogenase-like beta-hydroxyacid dehydrogenase
VFRVVPWIAAYCGTITHMGPLGAGQLAKSASQSVVCATIAAWAEAMDYARAVGLDPARFLSACTGAGSDSSVRAHFGPHVVAGTLEGETIRNMIKETEIIRDVADAAAVPMPLAEVVRSRIRKGDGS